MLLLYRFFFFGLLPLPFCSSFWHVECYLRLKPKPSTAYANKITSNDEQKKSVEIKSKNRMYSKTVPVQTLAVVSNEQKQKTCNAHRNSKCKCHWWARTHQLTWKRYARLQWCCDGQTCTNLRQTNKTQQTLILLIKNIYI